MFVYIKKIFCIFLILLSFNVNASNNISDIQIEGLQRVNAGLVFNNIPFEIGDDINEINFSQTISLLYKTGQFKDVTIEKKGTVIFISLREKPLLFELNFYGTSLFQPEALTAALNQMNISSGLVLDESDIERAKKELESQYLANGKYTVKIKSEIIPLSNNRVNVNFHIDEGSISRIKEINIIGNFHFNTQDLLDEISLKTTNYMSWWHKDDRYSKQVLTGDLEKLTSFYMNKGYLDFKITSSIVSISKNRKNIYININIDEGKKYHIGKLIITSQLPKNIDVNSLQGFVSIKSGDIFNRKLINDSAKNISKYLGNYGYAFANVSAVPSVNSDNRVVDFNFIIDEGKKVYVRRINIIGNESTKDEVIRREIRQQESAWFSQEKIDLSKLRLNRTQYFESVNIETPAVPGSTDLVDINILLKETNTGKFSVGAGISSSEGVVGTFGLQQGNFLGTGNLVKTDVSLGGINKVWSLTFMDPYWTDDGVSRGFTTYYRDIDTKELNTGDYKSSNYGFGVDFGIPLSEFKTLKAGVTLDFTELDLKANSAQKYRQFCADIDKAGSLNCNADSLLFYTSWVDNSINNPFFPTEGHKLAVSADFTTPGLDLEYIKVKVAGEKFFTISDNVVTKIKGSAGWADSYGDSVYPFFKNFRVGGKTSVRGYKEGAIGKKTRDSSSNEIITYGGKKMLSFGAETFFPVPFVKKSDDYRLSFFAEGGAAFEDSINTDDMRYSAGIGATWLSGFGPLNVSISIPLNEKDDDQTEKFQFGMGSSF